VSEKVLFIPTPKQDHFITEVFRDDLRFIAYGGAAGGGKTFVSLAILISMCRFYPNSRWCVLRKSLTEIKLNTIPSFWKVCPRNFIVSFNKSEFTCIFKNGSSIIFKGENIDDDPELQWMDGLEVNGFLLEQAEELSAKTYDKCKLRAGRHVIDPMPPIKILLTLNPAQAWTKELIYTPYVEDRLMPPYAYVPARISDNSYLPKEYVDGLESLDPITYRRFVEGDWSAFAINNPFAYAFNPEVHVADSIEYNSSEWLQLSFDFNVDPMTCVLSQSKGNRCYFIDEFTLKDSDIYQMCDRIKAKYPTAVFLVTGDATGHNRSALAKGNINYYTVIKQRLNLGQNQLKVPGTNPSHEDSRVLTNSMLQNAEIRISKTGCPKTIQDLQNVEVDDKGDIKKANRKDEFQRADLLDCFRYTLSTFHKNFVKYHSS
jgi:phage terminase large subunit